MLGLAFAAFLKGELSPIQSPIHQNDLMEDIRLCEKIFQEDRIAEAYILYKNIEQYLKEQEIVPMRETIEKYMNGSAVLQQVSKIGVDILDELRLMHDADQWNLWNNNIGPRQDVSVYTHRLESKGIYHFKLAGEIRRPLKEVLPAILENDLYQYWLPMCNASEVLSSPSTFRRIIKTELNFVLFQKICVSDVRADILPDGSAAITIKPILTSDPNAHFLPRMQNQRMHLWGSILIKEEDKIEQLAEEEDFPNPQNESDFIINRVGASGSDASFGQIYRDRGSFGDTNQMVSNIDLAAVSADLDNIYSLNFIPTIKNARKTRKVKVIKIQATFKADMLSENIQDWIFNLAMRSTISMFIPMLEHHASLFKKDGIHYPVIEKKLPFYEQIEEKIREYQQRNQTSAP